MHLCVFCLITLCHSSPKIATFFSVVTRHSFLAL